MSVLTVTGTSIPAHSPICTYHAAPIETTLSLQPQETITDKYPYTRADRKSYTVTVKEADPPSTNHTRSKSQLTSSLKPILKTPPAAENKQAQTSLPASRTALTKGHSRQSSSASTYSQAKMSMHRQGTVGSTASAPRRSTSSRSSATSTPTSYVALMRKQKATVWCDRAQSIDPRLAAAQRVAKQRAVLEVTGPSYGSGVRTSTITSAGVVGKMRHGNSGKPGYTSGNMSGAVLPVRLSTNETLGDDEEEVGSLGDNSMINARTGSGKSSASSAKYRRTYPRTDGRPSNHTPPSGTESPNRDAQENYKSDRYSHDVENSRPGLNTDDSEDSFGELKEMFGPSSVQQAQAKAKQADELRRKGSIDDRTPTLTSTIRLFVANPDPDS